MLREILLDFYFRNSKRSYLNSSPLTNQQAFTLEFIEFSTSLLF